MPRTPIAVQAALVALLLLSMPASAQTPQKPYEPKIGQGGKDVVSSSGGKNSRW